MNTLDPESGQGTGAHVEFTGGGGGGMVGVVKDDMGGVDGCENKRIFRSSPYTVKPVLFK